MKLLTLNTHSLIEKNYSRKLADFVSAISEQKPDIIALQEVNQTICETEISEKIKNYIPCKDEIIIRKDNHIYNVAEMLYKNGIEYYWTWLPLKKGYNKYEEGIAVMSISPIIETDIVTLSNIDDYDNWKTRKIIGIRTEKNPDEWFFSVHYGWWNDIDEPFQQQWKRTVNHMQKYDTVWLMGDFNNPSEIKNEGYDMIKGDNWYDSFLLAEKKDSGITVEKVIDGWQDKIKNTDRMRIDHIWCNKKTDIKSSEVIFNGRNYSVVSDHYGVMIKY